MRANVDAAAGRRARTSIASPTTLAPLRMSSPASRRDGQRLTRQRGLVEHGPSTHEAAVDGDDLAGEHNEEIPLRDVSGRHVHEAVRVAAVRHGGRASRERSELAPGAPERTLVQQLAAGQHQGNHEPCLELAQCERPGHGEQRDHVGSQLAVRHPPHDRERQRHDHADEHDDPDGMSCASLAGEPQQQPCR